MATPIAGTFQSFNVWPIQASKSFNFAAVSPGACAARLPATVRMRPATRRARAELRKFIGPLLLDLGSEAASFCTTLSSWGMSPLCHPEERSDEGSALAIGRGAGADPSLRSG